MALIPPNTCRRCHRQYSGLKSRCPYCGTRKTKSSTRTAEQTTAATPGTAQRSRAETNAKWQLIFGIVIIAAIIIALIILISVCLNNRGDGGSSKKKDKDPVATDVVEVTEAMPTPVATPEPTVEPTPTVTSIDITFLGSVTEEFSMDPGDTIQLKGTAYPVDSEATVEWSSSDESIMTVDETGLVTGVSSGWATVYATCGAVTAECRVWVR